MTDNLYHPVPSPMIFYHFLLSGRHHFWWWSSRDELYNYKQPDGLLSPPFLPLTELIFALPCCMQTWGATGGLWNMSCLHLRAVCLLVANFCVCQDIAYLVRNTKQILWHVLCRHHHHHNHRQYQYHCLNVSLYFCYLFEFPISMLILNIE